MKLPSKTLCQLAALSRALTDPLDHEYEEMDNREMWELVREVAESHTKLEERELDSACVIMSINDSAIEALNAIKNGAPLEVIEQCIHNILEAIHDQGEA